MAYSVYLVSGDTKYNLTPAVVSIELTESKNQIAQCATVTLMNINVGNTTLAKVITDRDRVYIYNNDSGTMTEVYRGFIWKYGYRQSLDDRELTLKFFDNLIFLQESEVSEFFASGKTTKAIFTKICGDWGIKLSYSYSSITHSKLALRGNLTDILTSDVLDLVKKRTGIDYVILSQKDTMYVKAVGQNSTIYQILGDQNAISTSTDWTKDGMVTKVVIVGKADDDDREPVEATVSGNTSRYGTLQKIIDRDENTTIASAKEEANNILKEDGKPKWTYEVKAKNIPGIRKGDKVYVNAGDIEKKYLIVTEIDRSIDNNGEVMTMTLTSP